MLKAQCERSTEFHFEDLAAQLAKVREDTTREAMPGATNASPLPSGMSRAERWPTATGWWLTAPSPATRAWWRAAGDVVVTIHSNLPMVHAVFHLIYDASTAGADGVAPRKAQRALLANPASLADAGAFRRSRHGAVAAVVPARRAQDNPAARVPSRRQHAVHPAAAAAGYASAASPVGGSHRALLN